MIYEAFSYSLETLYKKAVLKKEFFLFKIKCFYSKIIIYSKMNFHTH